MRFEEFVALNTGSVPSRRKLSRAMLNALSDEHSTEALEQICAQISSICGADGSLTLETPGGPIYSDCRYELRELTRDIALSRKGFSVFFEPDFYAPLSVSIPADDRDPEAHPHFERSRRLIGQASVVAETLGNTRFAAFLTDRDGTVNGYCARYSTSVQPAWTALLLTRFMHTRCDRSVVLTAGPLQNTGIVDISTMPVDTAVLAGSKGREFRLEDGTYDAQPLPEERSIALERFSSAVSKLHTQQRYRLFAYVGSGLQCKHGLTTVSYQDVAGSVPQDLSEEFRSRIVAEVQNANEHAGEHAARNTDARASGTAGEHAGEYASGQPYDPLLAWEDTGRDIEVALREGGAGDTGFDKGDGIRFLSKTLPLHLNGKRVLVCGDTASDIPMVEQVQALGARVETVFVGVSEEVRDRVRSLVPTAVFVDSFEPLVIGLHMLVSEEEYEYDAV